MRGCYIAKTFLLSLLALVLLTSPSQALDIEQKQWGFSNTVRHDRFNLLSMLVKNTDTKEFKGSIQLRGSISDKDIVVIEKDLFLASGSSRWLQWAPFIEQNIMTWRVTWTVGDELFTHEIGRGKVGPPARVLFSVDAAERPVKGIPSFQVALFPQSVNLTSNLHSALLAHQPYWSDLQQKAFIDWLYQGGTVHLFLRVDGSSPSFEGILAPLNTKKTETLYGQGLIIRHKNFHWQLSVKKLTELGFLLPTYAKGRRSPAGGPDLAIIKHLRGFVRGPQYNWPLLLATLMGYILFAGPVNWYIGKKVRNYKISLIYLLLCSAIFSSIVYMLGRQGTDNSAQDISIVYARPISDGYAIDQWSNLFVTTEDSYSFTLNSGRQYLTNFELEGEQVTIRNGEEASYKREIPLFSHTDSRVSTTVKSPPMIKELHSLKLNWKKDGIDDLRLKLIDAISPDRAIVWASMNDKVYELEWTDEQWVLSPHPIGMVQFTDELCNTYGRHWGSYEHPERSNFHTFIGEDKSLAKLCPKKDIRTYSLLLRILMVRALDHVNGIEQRRPKSIRNKVDLFIISDAFGELRVKDWQGQRSALSMTHISLVEPLK
ncbi:MAG: hypothetical protein P1V97_05205 [Planctomycetota bacterium]|nr:hypothetical protein [Planctomycetota bacterium]